MALQLTYYGNGPVMAKVLTAVSYVLNSSSYYTLLQIVLVLAGILLLRGWKTATLSGPHMSAHHITVTSLLVLTLFYGGYAAKYDMVVYDPIQHFQTSVRHVPAGAALVVWLSNQLENGFADLFDKGFTASGFPDQFNYDNMGGRPGALLAVSTLGNIMPQFYTLSNIEQYIQNCLFPAIRLGIKPETVFDSPDLINDMQVNLSDAWATIYESASNPQGATIACTQAWTNIKKDIETSTLSTGDTTKELQQYLKALGIITQTGADAQSLLSSASAYMFRSAQDARQILSQAILINALNPKFSVFAQENSVPETAFNAAMTQSILNTKNAMTTSYALAVTFLPLAYLVVNSLIIAILPLGFALMFIPELSRKYGMMLLDLLLWVAFWGPVASIINFLVQAYGANSLASVINGSLTTQNFTYLATHSQTLMSVAGDLMFSVPIIAFALASGSAYAMTGMVNSVTGLSRGIAQNASSRFSTYSGIESENAQAASLAKESAENKNGKLIETEYNSAYASGTQAKALSDFIKKQMNGNWNSVEQAYEKQEGLRFGEMSAFSSVSDAMNVGKYEGTHRQAQMKANIENALKNFGGNLSREQRAMVADTLLHTTGDWKTLQQNYGKDAEKLLQNTSAAKYAQEATNFDQLRAIGGGDLQKGAVMMSIANLNSLRHSRELTGFMKQNGLLPTNYDKMNAEQQVFALWSGMQQMGATIHDINVDGKHFESIALDKNGKAIEETVTNGYTGRFVTPQGTLTQHRTIEDGKVGNVVQQDLNNQKTLEAGYYANLGNAINTLYHTGSVNGFVKGLKKEGLLKLLGTNNENEYMAAISPLADNYAAVEASRYTMHTQKDTKTASEKQTSTDYHAGASVGVGVNVRGTSVGGSIGASKDLRYSHNETQSKGQGNNYETTFNKSLNDFRVQAMKIYDETKDVKDENIRANIRARMLGNIIRNDIGLAKAYQEQGIASPPPTAQNIPVMSADNNPNDFKNVRPAKDTWNNEVQSWNVRMQESADAIHAVGATERKQEIENEAAPPVQPMQIPKREKLQEGNPANSALGVDNKFNDAFDAAMQEWEKR